MMDVLGNSSADREVSVQNDFLLMWMCGVAELPAPGTGTGSSDSHSWGWTGHGGGMDGPCTAGAAPALGIFRV